MSVDAAGFVQDEASGLFVPSVPQARRSVIPWADLNAADPPYRWSQISPDLLSTLAVLSAQGVDRPRLLSVDDAGALKVGSRINAITTLGAPLAALATVATVKDTSQFFPGDHVSLVKNGAPASICTDVIVKSIDSPTQMTFNATCAGLSFAVGDFVIGEQTVQVRNIFNPVHLTGQGIIPTGYPNPIVSGEVNTMTTIYGRRRLMVDDQRSADWDSGVANVTPAAASITKAAAGVGARNVLHDIVHSIDNTSAGAVRISLRVWDGASGSGVLKLLVTYNTPANASTVAQLHDLRIKGSDNTQMVIDFHAGGVNIAESLYANGYEEA